MVLCTESDILGVINTQRKIKEFAFQKSRKNLTHLALANQYKY